MINIYKELYIFYRICDKSFNVTLFPTICIIFSQYLNITKKESLYVILIRIFNTLLYNSLFIYQFDLANQINGINEDKINNPKRPIVSGLININGAYYRWKCTLLLYLLLGFYLDFYIESFIWVIITILLYFLRFDKNWFLKNILIFPGIYIMISVNIGILNNTNILFYGRLFRWIIMISVIGTMNLFIQDFRDIKGDLNNNRITYPMFFGKRARLISCIISLISIFIMYLEIINHEFDRLFSNHLYFFINAIILITIGLRILLIHGKQNDNNTYQFLALWYCINCLSCPILSKKSI